MIWPRFGSSEPRFADRADAGRRLAEKLAHLADADTVVLGLPRGGVAVAYEVAKALDAPLDVVVARKLGAPHQPELAIGAIAPGVAVLRAELIEVLGIPNEAVARIAEQERARAADLETRLRRGRPASEVAGRTAIVVDDGLATGATATAAVRSVRRRGPARVVLAVPVAAPESLADLESEVDEAITVIRPRDMHAVGMWYEEFPQLTDEEVEAMLDERAAAAGATRRAAGR